MVDMDFQGYMYIHTYMYIYIYNQPVFLPDFSIAIFVLWEKKRIYKSIPLHQLGCARKLVKV